MIKLVVNSVRQRTSEWEKLKYHAARFAWRRRHYMTPSYRCTWGEWFEQRYNESLSSYASKIKEQKDAGGSA